MRLARTWGLMAVVLSLVAVPAADAATLRLDATFGDGGIARAVPFRFPQTAVEMRPLRPVRQPDGKVLVAASGYFLEHGPSEVLLARFTRSGRPDPTFGHGGREQLGLRWNFDPRAVDVQRDGRILVLGATGYDHMFYPGPGQFGLIRLLPDGSRDRAFGTNGFVAWNPPWRASTFYLNALPGVFVPQGDGRVFAAGDVEEAIRVGDPPQWPYSRVRRVVFVRFNSDGSVDESFGRAGLIEGPDRPWDFFSAWAAFPDGRIAALSSRNEGFSPTGPITWWLHRFNPDGTPDGGFGQDGSVRREGLDGVTELLPARDGSLVMIGPATAIRRILPGGQLDSQFGTACGRPGLRTFGSGGAVTSDGGVLATAGQQGRIDSFVFRYGADGCVAGRPLRLRSVSAGPPSLHGRRTALVSATYDHSDPADGHDALALIRIHR